jgi:hypothetical protein
VSVSFGQTHAPWKVLATKQVKVSPDSAVSTFTLIPSESEAQGRLSISGMGLKPGAYNFDELSLRPGGIGALRKGEQIGNIPWFKKSDLGARTPAAQADWYDFLYGAESGYWLAMNKFIKEELKARSLVVGSASGFSPWGIQAQLDVVDAHSYWQHPHFPRRPWDMEDWNQKNIPLAGTPDGGALAAVGLRRVAGKPFIVTEYNHASPNTYSSEAFLEVCALGALQDWDGIFAFAYSHRSNDWDTRRLTSFFDIDQHPTKMATLPAALALFYRADVQPPPKPHIAQVDSDEQRKSYIKGGSWVDVRAYGIRAYEMFQRPVSMQLSLNPDRKSLLPDEAPAVITSDNGQLTWDTTARRMLVTTPRSVGLVGQVKAGESIALGPVIVTPGETMQNWATINVTAMDGKPIGQSARLLITATGYTGNVGMQWKDAEKTSVGTKWGHAPSVVEGVPATLRFRSGRPLKAWPLDERGQRRDPIPVDSRRGGNELKISPDHQTLWWELSAN